VIRRGRSDTEVGVSSNLFPFPLFIILPSLHHHKLPIIEFLHIKLEASSLTGNWAVYRDRNFGFCFVTSRRINPVSGD
jgi:hypothetical protein